MFTKKSFAWMLNLVMASLLLSACGGEGDSTPPARTQSTISGNVFDAPVNGASVHIWEYDGGNIGRKLATTTTDAFGDYRVDIESISQPLLISAQGGSYTDPLTNEIVSVSNDKILRLDGVINFSEGSNQNVMLTPLSNIAAGLAKYKMAQGVSSRDAVSQSISTISNMYGFNVNETRPIDITRGGQSSYASAGHKYGALLTAYSSYSHDLIGKYGDSNHIYTSMHLADIQYRDVVSDGLLNGEEISQVTGALTPLSFGRERVTSDIYTHDLAQHVLIVVNDPNLNVSGTSAEDYVEFSNQINAIGTSGAEGVVPPRDDIEIDTTPPEVRRTNSGVLAGIDSMDISLIDEIGVEDVSAYLQYQRYGTWSEELACDDHSNYGSEYCSIDYTDFEKGLRETSARVMINTSALDDIYGDGESYTSEARMVFYTSDVLGNQLKQGVDQGHTINFEWDNEAPVIKVTSASTINNQSEEYVLKGTVKEEYQDISRVMVSFNGGLKEDLVCTPIISEVGNACEFSKPYKTSDFSSTTLFEIEASDSKGNTGKVVHEVSRDDQKPTQVVTYPDGGTLMTYVKVGVDGERTTYDSAYTQGTYTEGTVQSSRDYLKIDFRYASNGIQGTIDGIDFKNFNVNLLKENKIPYVEVRISDISYGSVLGSSAEKLELVVEYYVSRNNDGNYSRQNTTRTTGSDEDFTANIPHKTIDKNGDGRVDEMIYYVPYVKEILGDSFSSTSEDSSQKLVIKTIDESNNESSIQEVFFRSSFDLPTMKVVTPFIGARVQLEGLSANGEFTSLSSCITAQNKEENSDNITLDVASCETTTDLMNYEFMRLRLISVANPVSHYYQWKTDAGAWQVVDLNKANIGAYFALNGSQTFYVTELSAYQTGLFDYQWNQVPAGEKTAARAKYILDDVTKALAGSNNDSFFGFDPTVVSYATNELLASKPIPNNPTNDYLHRFLVEAIDDLSEGMPRNSSLDFASAIYDDFSFDGKANGIGAGNNQITLDTYQFSSNTYRTDLAQAYFDVMTGSYGVADNIAQLYADDISLANPNIGGESIFDGPGSSIDVLPPQPTLSIDVGREVIVNNKRYVAGEIISRILLEDPSGIVTTEGSQPKFTTMWYGSDDPLTPNPIDVNITEGPNGNSYRKEYFFTLDTQAANLKQMLEFVLHTSAKDVHGNSYGYDGKDPYIESLYVDNDYPVATYIPPNDVQGNPIASDIYLNAKNVHELTFEISDTVGDKRDARGLVFYKPTGEKATFTPQDFSANSQDSFKVKLCTGDVCKNQGQTIYPGDGNWLVVVQAEDNLNNSVSELVSTAPRFNILIDSEAPIVSGGQIAERLGGNSIWAPVINWGSLSQGSDVQIDLRRGSGQAIRLAHCDPALETCDLPYLIGEQPDVKVQLVSSAFDYAASNEFYVTATDKAYPANVSTQGIFTFQVDNVGPEILLNTPWVEDALSKESYVLGREFNVRFTSVTDDSKIAQVSLFQEGFPDPIKTMIPIDPSKAFVMSLNKSDTDKIDTTAEEKTTSLYVQATDVNGFESQTNTNHIILDRDGPTLRLSGYNESDYYLGNYVFNLIAQDLNANGNTSIEGVDKESLEYWTFSDAEPLPGSPGTDIGEDLKVPLHDLSTGLYSLRLKGSDVRGNETLTSGDTDLKIKVNNAIPQVALTMAYEDGTPITNNTVYQGGNVILTLNIVDESGVDKIDSTYKLVGEASGTSLTFFEQEPGKWTATLLETQIAADGRYELDIKVYNKVRYLNESDRKVGAVNQTLSVQREGVALTIVSPADFVNYKANGTLNVTFNTSSEVKAKTLECWVRDGYNSNEAPPTNDAPYSGVINVSQEPYSCSLTSTQNMSQSPVTLITRTVGTNGRETVSKFNFAMMDVDAPTVVDGDSYSFNHNDVWFDEAQNIKMLTFDLTFNDDLAGVNTSSQSTYPKLVRLQGNRPFTPQECTTGVGNVKCTYSELYSDIINGLSVTQEYKITQLADMAGNLTPDHNMLLKLPQGNVEVLITDPVGNTTVNGEKMVVKFRIKLYENSRLDNLVARVGSDSYNYKDNRNNFTQLEVCADDPEYQCSEFSSDLPADSDGQTLRTIITATDVWARTGEDSVDIRVDNSAPVIGEEVIVTPSDVNPGKVRFRFDITDTGSGVDTVSYRVLNPSYQEDKTEDGTGSASYFELDATQLEGRDSITVDITATDKVGLYTNVRKIIDVSAPQVTVGFEAGASIESGKLMLKDNTQPFSISTVESAGIQATGYSIDFIPTAGDSLNYSGNIAASSASGTMNFAIDDQAVYNFKVTVTDSIGRTTQKFEMFSNSYDAKGIESVVDYQAPVVSGVTATQISMVPKEGKYNIDLTAYVEDKNLTSVTSVTEGGAKPQSITEPANVGDPYVMHYLLSPGEHTFKVVASDLVNNNTEKVTTAKVEAASVPELTISTTASSPLAGGVEVPLTFTFTEEVTNFNISDVRLEASDSGNSGELKPLSWSTDDNITWTVKYITPERENKNITIRVDDYSYESINTIPGTGDSLLLGVEGASPELTKVTFNPTHQELGKSVNVKLEFNKELQAASAELGGSAITLTKTADASIWTGDVVVPATSDLTVGLVVKDYQDLVGNTGAQDSTHSMPITPTLAINTVGNVDGSNAAALQITGTSTRFDGQAVNIEIKAQGSETVIASGNATVQGGGDWTSSTMDISGQPNATYRVEVTGTNSANVEATETSTFTLSQSVPTLTSATFTPAHQAEGQSVSVRLEFDKELQAASAELGGSVITLTKTADASIWTGDVVVPATSDLTAGLVVKDYQDLVGNTGAEDSTHSMPITPTLAINSVGNVDGSNAAALQITGTSTRFDGQAVSIEIKAQGSETVIASGNATVQSGGAWASSTMDISGQPNATYRVEVTGTNAANVEATETSTFTLSQSVPTLTSATFNPTHQAEGQSVSVRLEFDKELQAASAELGGSAITLTKTADASIWTGDVVVPATSDLTVGLVVKDYQDLVGNTGAEDSTHSMPITPTLAINSVGNVDGSNAAALQITGTSTRFDGQAVNIEIKAQGNETVIASGNATVQSGGAWASSTMDISGQPNATYRVEVTGTNAANVEATETSTFTLSQSVPTLTSATFNPTHQAEGQSVSVRLEFDKELQAASAELGGSAITLNKTADASIWTGDVVVPATSDLTAGLVVKDYQDLVGNTGAQDSTHSMPITPTLAINTVGNVDGSNAAALQVTGTSTRFDGQAVNIEIKAQGSETVIASGNATVQSGGDWTSSSMDISGQPNATYRVEVTGTNAANVDATETSTFTLSQSVPTLTSATFNPTHQAEGQSVSVRLEFDKELQAASAELGGTAITLNKTADASIWTGDVVVPATSDLTAGLVVKDYQDLVGNTGAEDSTHSMPITPTISLETINDVTGSTTVTVNGTSTRFEEGDIIELKAVDSDGLESTGNTAVLIGGTWTADLDLSTLKEGSITVYANGTNVLSATADEVNTTFNYSSTTVATLVIPDYWQSQGGEIALHKAA